MRVTQAMLARGFGGAERYFVDLTRALADDGHEVQVICHRGFRERHAFADHPRIRVDAFSVFGTWDRFAAQRMRSRIASFNPELVHAHLARAAHLIGRGRQALGVPLLVKTHNYVDLRYYRHVDHFIATTASQQAYLTDQGVPATAVDVIPNFSALAPERVPLRDRPDTWVLVSYGRLVAKKGFHILLAAMQRLLHDGAQLRVILGGDGPEREPLQALAQRLGVNRQVEFRGWCEDVGALLREADLFVLPSLDEPFGIAVLEAMALHRPIVATRTAGPMEILDESMAWLVDADEPSVLAGAIGAAMSDGGIRFQRAAAAHAHFLAHYSRAAVVPRVVALYDRLRRASTASSSQ